MTSGVSHRADTLSCTRRVPLSEIPVPVGPQWLLSPAQSPWSQPANLLHPTCDLWGSCPPLRRPRPLCSLIPSASPTNSQARGPQAQLSSRRHSTFRSSPRPPPSPCRPPAVPFCPSGLPDSLTLSLSVAPTHSQLNSTSGPPQRTLRLSKVLSSPPAWPSESLPPPQPGSALSHPHVTLSGQHSLHDFALVCTPMGFFRVFRAMV